MATAISLALSRALLGQAATDSAAWSAYGRDAGGTRYAPLEQITRHNVATLRLAWVYRTGELLAERGRFEATPLFVDGTVYLATPLARVIALDPTTGAERWSYDPRVDLHGDYGDFTNRGVSTWVDTRAPARTRCRRRIYVATVDARLIALDATTGERCQDFGVQGAVDLKQGLVNAPAYAGEYEVTSPPAVVGDLVVVGSSVADNHRTDAPDGVVRAYDARTGAERWRWDPVARRPGAPGYDTWRGPKAHTTGAANAWSVLSADPARDLVFVPTGSASPDYYGGERLGQNLYANSVVALRASTGQVVWSFQVVHHDLWDYDAPAEPVAFTLARGDSAIPALAVATKMGHLFILDRRTGVPLVPVEERPVPQTDVPGEETWPTQPFPPAAFRLVPESLPAADAFGVTPEAREECRQRIAALRSEGIFTPPSLRGSLHYPGTLGGTNWSGVAVDERHGWLVVPTNHLPMVVTLVPRDSLHAVWMARRDRTAVELGQMQGTPFGMLREVLWTTDHHLCNPPPWGQLTAFDPAAGEVKWQVPLGYLPELAAHVPAARAWGSPALGGALVTAGGLVFIAGTFDQQLRAFDVETGDELWRTALPAGGHALPMTYVAGGRQYVVIAAGGHDRLHTAFGDYVLAFTLAAPGAPSPDTAARPLAGRWAGELRIGEDRHPTTLAWHSSGDSLAGDMVLTDIQAAGPVTGHAQGSAVTLQMAFTYPAKHCGGVIVGGGAQANGGQLLEGTLRVTGTCSDHAEVGTFALWRRARGTRAPVH
ncbi:MAG TPA: pyrroloquinoline quinone-dependent dehydrogenase [Gemmatimonadales bacterium]|nr:pyrroloquinoline quinone-dependent dehydrogenase [Gemmatimonadales bacterium]